MNVNVRKVKWLAQSLESLHRAHIAKELKYYVRWRSVDADLALFWLQSAAETADKRGEGEFYVFALRFLNS